VPLAISYAKTDEARDLIRAGLHDMSTVIRNYTLPPATPKDRVQLLRNAFLATLKDPKFAAEAGKANLEIEPSSGEELEKTVKGLFKVLRVGRGQAERSFCRAEVTAQESAACSR
jgi:hypothetical protein